MAVPNALLKRVHDVAKAERADRKVEAAQQRKLRTLVDVVGVQRVLTMLASIVAEDEAHIDDALRGGG